jgi:hypothetical protein
MKRQARDDELRTGRQTVTKAICCCTHSGKYTSNGSKEQWCTLHDDSKVYGDAWTLMRDAGWVVNLNMRVYLPVT